MSKSISWPKGTIFPDNEVPDFGWQEIVRAIRGEDAWDNYVERIYTWDNAVTTEGENWDLTAVMPDGHVVV